MFNDYSVIKEQIKEAIDVLDLLAYYGVDIKDKNIKYDKIRTRCPIHDGDGETNFSFDLNFKSFTCFSRGCGNDLLSRDVFSFIALMEEKRTGRRCSFLNSLKIASEITGIPITKSDKISREVKDRIDNNKWIKQQQRLNKKIELETLDECLVEMYRQQYHPYLESRNFSEDILDIFEIGYSEEGIEEPEWVLQQNDFPGRIVVPIRDDQGRLVGLSGRLASDDKSLIKKFRKYKNMVNFDKGFVLYNYDRAKENIIQSNQIILTEGFFDVMRLYSFGADNAVAVMGASLTPEQLRLIIQHTMDVYIFFDGDEAGKVGSNLIAEQLYSFSIDSYIVKCPKGVDPDEMSDIDFWKAMAEAEKYIRRTPIPSIRTNRRKAI